MLVTGDSLGSHGLAEAKALIIRHRDVVLAVANALMTHRTLDAVMNRKIIASAPERARRADWKIVEKNAADFAARGFDGQCPNRRPCCCWRGPSLPVSGVQQT